MDYSELNKILKGEKHIGKKLTNKIDLMNIGDVGLTKQTIIDLAKLFYISQKQIISLLPISSRTFQRYTPEQHLNINISEQIIYITDVFIKGLKVFEDKQKFLLWLDTPSLVFSYKKPFSLLTSRFGIDLISEELSRIEHGVYI